MFAVWLGLGFDWMDAFLFNFVAPLALTDLLDLAPGPGARSTITAWTGIMTAVMLLGWAVGGMFFGRLSDRIGRARIVVFTILLYSIGTAAAAVAPNVWVLLLFRFVAAIGIGGEWAAGVTLVAETVPEDRRVSMAMLLASSAAAGTMIAMIASRVLTAEIPSLAADPDLAWRLVMAVGLAPAALALFLRRKLREPERWTKVRDHAKERAGLRALFSPELRRRTLGGVAIATLTLVSTWAITAFLPALAFFLADEVSGGGAGAEAIATRASYITRMMLAYQVGALLGIFLGGPVANWLGRRRLFLIAFLATAVAIIVAFLLDWHPATRLLLVALVACPIGAATGSLHYYLTELFPIELRGTGASFCMNAGRIVTMAGPASVGIVAGAGVPVLHVLAGSAIIPLLGFLVVAAGVGIETRGKPLDPV